MRPRWGQNGAKMGPRWGQNGAKMGPKWGQNGAKMGPQWVQNGSKMGPKWVQNGSTGVLTALLRPHHRRVQTGTALLRHCRGCLTGDAWECLLRCCGHAAGAFKLAALLRHCHGRVNTSPELPSHLWAGPQLPGHLWGRPADAPQSPSQLPGTLGKRSLSSPAATPHIRTETMAAESYVGMPSRATELLRESPWYGAHPADLSATTKTAARCRQPQTSSRPSKAGPWGATASC